MTEQCLQPRQLWKQLRSAHTPLPVSLQPVQLWDLHLQQLADIREAGGATLPEVAYPQQPLQPAASLNDPVSEENVEEGLLRLHNGRAKGMQGLPSEFLRYAKQEPEPGKEPPVNMLVPVITAVLNAAFCSGIVPQDINGALITPVFEKGDPLNTANYRPIVATDPIMRLYAGILNAGIVEFLESAGLRAAIQTGFRPDLATQHNLFAI